MKFLVLFLVFFLFPNVCLCDDGFVFDFLKTQPVVSSSFLQDKGLLKLTAVASLAGLGGFLTIKYLPTAYVVKLKALKVPLLKIKSINPLLLFKKVFLKEIIIDKVGYSYALVEHKIKAQQFSMYTKTHSSVLREKLEVLALQKKSLFSILQNEIGYDDNGLNPEIVFKELMNMETFAKILYFNKQEQPIDHLFPQLLDEMKIEALPGFRNSLSDIAKTALDLDESAMLFNDISQFGELTISVGKNLTELETTMHLIQAALSL